MLYLWNLWYDEVNYNTSEWLSYAHLSLNTYG